MTEGNTIYAHCCVKHPDAGGRCAEPLAVEVYGLNFCEVHGEEMRIGAALEEQHEVTTFLERFNDRGTNSPVEKAIRAVALAYETPASDTDYLEALTRAYPNVPERVRENVAEMIAGEEPERASVLDDLLDTLHTLHRLQRIAHAEYQTYLVEILERERESVAAQTVVALEHADHRRPARG